MSTRFCQSCTLPIENPDDRGTEQDGSKSNLYCKYCYQHGSFTDPGMTLEQMKEIAGNEMRKSRLPESFIEQTLKMLPNLQRWQTTAGARDNII